jgi:hypothetical protein
MAGIVPCAPWSISTRRDNCKLARRIMEEEVREEKLGRRSGAFNENSA